eukprot:scaffold221979_cov33-Tisochrysis_lutea.AAC.4
MGEEGLQIAQRVRRCFCAQGMCFMLHNRLIGIAGRIFQLIARRAVQGLAPTLTEPAIPITFPQR